MHTAIISFADRVVYNIKTNDMKDLILEQLYKLYGIKIIQKHYHKLDENNIKYIKNNPHLCNLRSNGNPYYMFFTLYNDNPIIYFIDKKVHPGYQKPRILLVRGLFDEKLFQNTLIDGEMVKNNDNKWLFIMNDIIVYEGNHLLRTYLPVRLNIMYQLLNNQYTQDKIVDVCEYRIKTYYYVCKESIQNLIELSKKLNYTCRGIYLWSYDLKYKPKLYNFNEENIVSVVRTVKDDTDFKMLNENVSKDDKTDIKNIVLQELSPKEETKCLFMTQTDFPDVYELYENENVLNTPKIGVALIPNLHTSKMIRIAFKNKNSISFIKVKCIYNTIFNKWHPVEIL